MNKDINDYVKSCDICQKCKYENQKPVGLLGTVEPAKHIFEKLYADFIGPLPTSCGGRNNKYLLVVVDELSRWVELKAMPTQTAKRARDFLEDDIFCRYGSPRILITDNGTHFANKIMKNLCKEWGVQHKFVSAYHPQPNLAERVNRELKRMISCYVSERHGNWDEHIQKFALALRTMVNKSTQVTPSLLNLGREIQLPIDRSLQVGNSALDDNSVLNSLKEMPKSLLEVINWVRNNIINAHAQNKVIYDKSHREVTYKIDDMVLMRNNQVSSAEKHVTAKLLPKWVGPYRICKVISPLTYILDLPKSCKLNNKRHVSDLKPYFQRLKVGKKLPVPLAESQLGKVPEIPVARQLRARSCVDYRVLAGNKRKC